MTERLVAWILLPFACMYWLALGIRRLLYRSGVFKSVRLSLKVISVGGITVGGSGKTPVVIHIAGYLESIGMRPIILTRGYGGQSGAVTVVRPGDDIADGALSDEVRLMSERTCAAIGVGANRVAAFDKAAESCEADIVVLDDGFQHLRIVRDLDILVLDATAPLGNGYLLPSGSLRESKASIGRAHVVVLTRVSQRGETEQGLGRLRDVLEGKVTVLADYVLDGISEVWTGESVSTGILSSERLLAFSAVANPGSFFSTLEREGLTICGREVFRDHHIFTESDMEFLDRQARAASCSGFVVTEKDAVKLRLLQRSRIPVYVFRIRLQITSGEDSLHDVIKRLIDDQA